MTDHEQSTALIARELAAIDEALMAGEPRDPDPSARELQELAIALRADAPEPDPDFGRDLRDRLEAGFPPRIGSARQRLAAGAGLAGGAVRRAREGAPSPRRLLPAFGVIAVILVVVVSAASLPSGSEQRAGQGGGGGVSGGGDVSSAPDAGALAAPDGAPRSAEGSAAGLTARPLPPPSGGGFEPGQRDRRIERSVALELEAPMDAMSRVADEVTVVTSRHGGFVLNSSVSTGEDGSAGEFELRIPADRLRAALRDLSALATVRSQSQSGRDVTRDVVTARDRLEAARAERRSLLRRLANADSDEEAEAIRARLDLVAGEINGLRGQLRDLRLRTDYAVVTVSLAADEDGSGEGSGGAGSSFDDALGDAGRLLVGVAGVTIRALAVAVPLGMFALLVWLAGAGLRRRRRESALA